MADISIKVNGLEINGNGFVVEKFPFRTLPEKEINTLKLTRKSGNKQISSNYGSKSLPLQGIIKGTSLVDLQDKINQLALATDEDNFDLIYNNPNTGEIRKWVVSRETLIFTEDADNITFMPFDLGLIANDNPFGIACDADGVPTSNIAFSQKNITADSVDGVANFDGTAKPKPAIQFAFDKAGDITSIDFINNETGQQISIVSDPEDGDIIIIDCEYLRVTLNGEEIDYSGVFPDFIIGENSITANFYSSSGTLLDQYQLTNNGKKPLYGDRKIAEFFVSTDNLILPKISLLLDKVGTPTGDIIIEIQEDGDNEPSGTIVDGGTATISASEVNETPNWISKLFESPPALQSESGYWIVIYTTGGDPLNCYNWHLNSAGGYDDGRACLYTSSWSVLTGIMCFKTFKNLVDQNNSNESADSISENFSATTNKDAGNTTADWNTSLGRLRLVATTFQDVQQTDYSDVVGVLGTNHEWEEVAQTFTPVHNISVSSISLYITKVGNPTALGIALNLNTYAGTPGPGGTTLASKVILSGSITNGWNTFTFTSPVNLNAGVTYQMEIYDLAGDDNNYFELHGKNSNVYAGGSMSYSGNQSWFWATADIAFKINCNGYVTSGDGQSNALDSILSNVVAATLTAIDNKPAGTAIAYKMSSDGSNFEDCSSGVEKVFENIGSALKFKADLSATSQSNTPYVDSIVIGFKGAVLLDTTNKRAAQSFISGFTGDLGRVELPLKKTGTPGNVTIKIYSDSGGNPNAELASQIVTADEIINSDFGWIACNFDTPPALTSGSTYWIVVSAASVDSSNYYAVRSKGGNQYASGGLKYSTDGGSNYSAYTNEDLLFKTFASSGNIHQVDLDLTYKKLFL